MNTNRNGMLGGLALAGAMILLACAGAAARKAGYVDPDTITRIVTGTIGLMLAWWGNRMPKAFVPSACARQAKRVGGWSMALSGLIYAALFAFAPLRVANVAGTAVILSGLAVTIFYCWMLRHRRTLA